MASIDYILRELDPERRAQKVDNDHQRARQTFDDRRIQVRDFPDLQDTTCRFYIHASRIVLGGGSIPRQEAIGEVTKILNNRNGRYRSVHNAFIAAQTGTNDGLPGVLDEISRFLQYTSSENYFRAVIDQYVSPVSWEEKKAIVREIFSRYRNILPASLQNADPDQFAYSHDLIIRSLVEASQKHGDDFWRSLP